MNRPLEIVKRVAEVVGGVSVVFLGLDPILRSLSFCPRRGKSIYLPA